MRHVHEGQIGAHVGTFVTPADYRATPTAQYGHEPTTGDNGAARRKALKSRLTRIKERYGWGDLDRADYLTERKRLQCELANLAILDEDAGDQLAAFGNLIANIGPTWEEAMEEQRNRMARLLFEEVVIKRRSVRGYEATTRSRCIFRA